HARAKAGHVTVIATGGGAQAQEPLTVTGTPVGVAVQAADTTIEEGRTVQLRAFVRDSINDTVPYRTIAYASGDTTVARVTPGGLVTGVGGGTVLVLASSGALGGSIFMTVRDSNLLASIPIGNAPYGVAVSAAGLAYVTSISQGVVHRINVATHALVDSISVGANAVQVAVSASGDTSYVSDRVTGQLYRLRWSTHTILDSVAVASDEYALAVTPSGEAFLGTGSGGQIYAVSFGGSLDSAGVTPP